MIVSVIKSLICATFSYETIVSFVHISATIVMVALSHAASVKGVDVTTSCHHACVVLSVTQGCPATVIVLEMYETHSGSIS